MGGSSASKEMETSPTAQSWAGGQLVKEKHGNRTQNITDKHRAAHGTTGLNKVPLVKEKLAGRGLSPEDGKKTPRAHKSWSPLVWISGSALLLLYTRTRESRKKGRCPQTHCFLRGGKHQQAARSAE